MNTAKRRHSDWVAWSRALTITLPLASAGGLRMQTSNIPGEPYWLTGSRWAQADLAHLKQVGKRGGESERRRE
jgi:hypothetical protein